MAMLSNLDLLRRVPLFSRLTVAQAEAIGSAVVKRRFKRGEVLVEQGQKSDALYLLLTGRARVTAADSRGREVILATLAQGDYLVIARAPDVQSFVPATLVWDGSLSLGNAVDGLILEDAEVKRTSVWRFA